MANTAENVSSYDEWAVQVRCRFECPEQHHIVECENETAARTRLTWWRTNSPATEPKLLTRTVLEIREHWRPVG